MQHIVEGARVLYDKYGIKSVTMDDVAKHLGISKKTLYQFVKDKADLVEKVVTDELDKDMKVFEGILRRNLNAIDELFELNGYVKRIIREYHPSKEYDLQKYYPELFARMKEMRVDNMYHTIKNNMQKGVREGMFREDINAETIARFHIFRMENIYEHNLCSMEELLSDDYLNEIFKYHIHGIANQNGLDYLKTL